LTKTPCDQSSSKSGPECHKFDMGRFVVSVQDGQISEIFFGDIEVSRGVTYLVRDENWATLEAQTSLRYQGNLTDNKIEISGEVNAGQCHFEYTISVEATTDSHLEVTTTGRALSSFNANRVGLSVLHPASICAGAELEVFNSNGNRTKTEFPLLISPSQPVFDIKKLSFNMSNVTNVEMEFMSRRPDGTEQAFEMEDQRNWGDASYKTYVGSLQDPWPYQVKSGEIFVQKLSITAERSTNSAAGSPAKAVSKGSENQQAKPLPSIGIAVPFGEAQLALENLNHFGCYRPDFISAYLKSNALDEAEIRAICQISEILQCPVSIELEIHGNPAVALEAFTDVVANAELSIEHLLACPSVYLESYQPDAKWPSYLPLSDFYELVRKWFPQSKIGGGMLTYFTELNRKWPPEAPIDFVGHAFCPIIHAADDTTIMQNTESLRYMAATVREKMPRVPHRIISASLSMRQNPYGAGPVIGKKGECVAMNANDPRESTLIGAIWMKTVLETLADTNVEAVVLGALSGPSSIYSARSNEGFHCFDFLRELSEIASPTQRDIVDISKKLFS